MPSSAGLVDSDVFAEAVSQVAVAAGRDDTLPMLTGVRLEIEDDLITLAATDRYRLAVREFAWRPGDLRRVRRRPGAGTHARRRGQDADQRPEIVLSLSSGSSGEGILGLSGKDRQTTTRLLDAEFVKYRAIMPNESNAHALLPVGLFTDAAKRVPWSPSAAPRCAASSRRARSPCGPAAPTTRARPRSVSTSSSTASR